MNDKLTHDSLGRAKKQSAIRNEAEIRWLLFPPPKSNCFGIILPEVLNLCLEWNTAEGRGGEQEWIFPYKMSLHIESWQSKKRLG